MERGTVHHVKDWVSKHNTRKRHFCGRLLCFVVVVVIVVVYVVADHNADNDTNNRQDNQRNEEADPSLLTRCTSASHCLVCVTQPAVS